MDLENIKSNADISSECEEYKRKYEIKKNEIKKNEIDIIKKGFIDYFKGNPDYVISETANSVTAKYNNAIIVLSEDDHANMQDPSMCVRVKIKMPDNNIHEIFTSIYSDYKTDNTKTAKTEQEIKLRDLAYHKAFVEGEVRFTFKYVVKEIRKEFENIYELLKEL